MEKFFFTLRPMQLGDIEQGMQLSSSEGWNQTEKDWKLLIENPGNISLVAEAENKVIATTTAINYSNEIAWIGMVLVNKNYRGRGVSKSLLRNILEKLRSCKSIKLDATPAGQQVYKKFGFADEYLITRMINLSPKSLPTSDDINILPEPILPKHTEEIAALDKAIFGANRIHLIKYLVKEYPRKAWLLKRNNKIEGFVLGRDGTKYNHIGPVAASSTFDAQILVSNALQKLNNQPVIADVPNDKEELLTWLHSLAFREQRQFMRMYMQKNPFPGIIDKHHLICGPEFG
jgi:predicted GNAT family N-acyltransferase